MKTTPENPAITAMKRDMENRESYISELIGYWYESAPYGEQVPKGLADDIVRLMKSRDVDMTDEEAWDMICEAGHGDPWLDIFEKIFRAAASYTIVTLANAVYDEDNRALKLIDLEHTEAGFAPLTARQPQPEEAAP